ncbi:hypothetical protein [Paenibacillus sp. YAF4_2]|uniref:hypothetical protein n=1 Tax=Paenibacillus sp. YAF4_2 TaxID=3233085 RepID=UPI003F961FD3
MKAVHFGAGNPEAEILQLAIEQKGANDIIRRHMGIPEEHALHDEIMKEYKRIQIYKA